MSLSDKKILDELVEKEDVDIFMRTNGLIIGDKNSGSLLWISLVGIKWSLLVSMIIQLWSN